MPANTAIERNLDQIAARLLENQQKNTEIAELLAELNNLIMNEEAKTESFVYHGSTHDDRSAAARGRGQWPPAKPA